MNPVPDGAGAVYIFLSFSFINIKTYVFPYSIFNYIHLHSINGERVSVVDVVDYPNAIGNPVKRNIVGVYHEPSTTNLNE